MSDADVEALVRRAAARDRNAFEQLMRAYDDDLQMWINVGAWRCSIEAKEDIKQDVWMDAWRGIGGFKHRAKFHTWLNRIAFNRMRRAPTPPPDPDSPSSPSRLPDSLSELTGTEMLESFCRAVDSLPAQRRLVYMHHIRAQTASTESDIDVRRSQYYVVLYEARKQVKRLLQQMHGCSLDDIIQLILWGLSRFPDVGKYCASVWEVDERAN